MLYRQCSRHQSTDTAHNNPLIVYGVTRYPWRVQVTLRLWDQDFLKPDDYLGEARLNLNLLHEGKVFGDDTGR